ncbi:hypothetical protein F5Y14DRAFT_438398 [Nemania sp. NC0429]|nr:hypothetical protein F5Y14DRAFT_438398 [Nemania sp. NC0429]
MSHEVSSVQRIGFTRLSHSDAKEAGFPKVNIIFVHGLRGHPQTTWEHRKREATEQTTETPPKRPRFTTIFPPGRTASNNAIVNEDRVENRGGPSKEHKVFWPRDYLPEDVPEAEIWTYGYNADVIGGLFQANNQNSISQHGRDLAVVLEREIQNEAPIVFVAHSLGGIVVKDAIRRSKTHKSRVKFVVFLGTPHRGSSSAGWGVVASNLATVALQDSNKQIVRALETNSEVLDNIHDEFLDIAQGASIKVHSFQEARAITGVKGLAGKVVDDYSSKVGLPLLETVESIDANHMDMAKCKDKTDPRYKAVVGVLKLFIRSLPLGGDVIGDRESGPVAQIESRRDLPPGETGVGQSTPDGKSFYYLPMPKNRRFTGRDAALGELQNRLFISKECQKLAVVGLGGVGKTQVVLQFAYWVKENHPDHSVFWVPAQSSVSFEQAYTEMARQLDCPVKVHEDLRKAVRQYLESEKAGKWLLIVDNADDMEILFGSSNNSGGIHDYLPQNDNGLVLFTTRSREAALAEMSVEEATEFLHKSLVNKNTLQDEVTADDLLEELAYLPLAIAQASHYLNATQLPIRKYLALLRGAEQDMIGLMSQEFRDNTRYRESRNAIRRSDRNAADLLSFMSYIEPKAIPLSILPSPPEKWEMETAIGTLCGYAFLVRRGDSDTFDMHRLQHNLAYETGARAIQHLASIFPSDDRENRSLWRDQGYQDREKFDLFYYVGSCLYEDRRFKEALVALEEAVPWRKQHLSETDMVYLENRHLGKAIKMLEHIVAIEKKTLAEEDHNRLASEHELARAYLDNQQTGEAIQMLEHVVAIRKKTLAEEDPSRLASEHELARAYLNNQQTREAIQMLEHVVAIRKKTLAEEDHPRLASEHELARAYLDNQQTGEAIQMLEHVVAIRKKTLAEEDHPRLASEHELARAYLDNQQTREAIKLLEHIIAIKKKTLAENDPSRLASEHELARAYLNNNQQTGEAIKLLEHIVAIEKKILAEKDPFRLASEPEKL